MVTRCPKCDAENPDTVKFCGECGTNISHPEEAQPSFTKTLETPVEELKRGTLFADRYEIIEELGSGGMGAVYRVEDTKAKEEIALKLIKPEIAAEKKTIERFRNELTTARKIRHKNICGMYDLNEKKGTHYITMEYVPGEDLKSFIRRSGRLDIPKALAIAKEISEGLAEAHRLGVVHRDLKSSNIMIDKEGNARIMDFGIARSLRSKGLTGEGIIIGTPEYMSPEQAEAKEVDNRSDIYSLGVILYEMVTGQLPFEGDTPLSIAMKHKGEIPKDPKQVHAQIPEDLSTVILRCMEKEKDDRYQSAGELRSELENIEKGIPTSARAVPERKPFTSKEITVHLSLKRLFAPALIVVALVVIAFILWKFLPQEKAVPTFSSDKPSVAIMYFMNQTGDESLDHWREALPLWIITDLSQSRYINVLAADRLYSILRGLNLLETRTYASEDLRRVAEEGRVNHIFQASYSKTGDIFRIDYSLKRADSLEIVTSDHLTGQSEESFHALVDDITKKIKANLELSEDQIINDFDGDAGTITTSSPEAFKYYSIGRKYLSQGDNRKSIELMEQAVAVDPEFAMAYRSMAASLENLNYLARAREFYLKAFEYRDRLSERERYRVEADYYRSEEKLFAKALESYEELLAIYPDDLGARHNLALLCANIEEHQKAIQHYEILINKYRSSFVYTHLNLAVVYRRLGLYDKAQEILENYLDDYSDNALAHRYLAVIYRHQERYDLDLEEADKAFSLAPTSWLNILNKGDTYFYMGDLEKAEEEYLQLLEKEEPSAFARGTLRLGQLSRLKGRFKDSIGWQERGIKKAEELGEKAWIMDRTLILADMDNVLGYPENALKKIEFAWKIAVDEERLPYQRRALNLEALAYLGMNRLAEAQRTADELKELIEQSVNRNLIRSYYHVMGRIRLAQNNYPEAIAFLEKCPQLVYPTSGLQMIYADSLGQAYFRSGDWEKAREEYQKIRTLRGRLEYGDIYAKSFYMLGKINEELDNTAKAVEHFGQFLDLWKDADPSLPEVDDARKRLAALKNQ